MARCDDDEIPTSVVVQHVMAVGRWSLVVGVCFQVGRDETALWYKRTRKRVYHSMAMARALHSFVTLLFERRRGRC